MLVCSGLVCECRGVGGWHLRKIGREREGGKNEMKEGIGGLGPAEGERGGKEKKERKK